MDISVQRSYRCVQGRVLVKEVGTAMVSATFFVFGTLIIRIIRIHMALPFIQYINVINNDILVCISLCDTIFYFSLPACLLAAFFRMVRCKRIWASPLTREHK